MQRSCSSSSLADRRRPGFRLPPLAAQSASVSRLRRAVAAKLGDSTIEASPSPHFKCRTVSFCSTESGGSPGTPCAPERCRSSPLEHLASAAQAGEARRSASKSRRRRHTTIGAPPGERSAQADRPADRPVRRVSAAWVKGKALGAGSFGTVCKAFDPETLQIFAVKEVAIDGSARQRERLSVELQIGEALRHPNIVSCLGHDYFGEQLCIYLEYMPGGSIASMLADFGALDAGSLRKATCGMLQGLDFLHTRSPPVVHRDLKGANLLVDMDMTVKLADFGCSKWCSESKSFTTLGSVPWMAPEVIAQVDGYGRKADIWSFGCTVIEMATAEKPWGSLAFGNMAFALNFIATSEDTPPVPDSVPPACRDLIAECTRRSQYLRPGTAELLRHEFVLPSKGTARRARAA